MKAIVVNFFGGPSAGKTTAALMTTGLLKMSGINAEYVHEFAKDLVYENREDTLSIQPYVTAKQYKKIAILKDKVDVIVTDSPFIIGVAYPTFGSNELFHQWLFSIYMQFDNYNVYLKRSESFQYQKEARTQKTIEEAIKVDKFIKNMLDEENIPYTEIEVVTGIKNSIEVAKEVIAKLGLNTNLLES